MKIFGLTQLEFLNSTFLMILVIRIRNLKEQRHLSVSARDIEHTKQTIKYKKMNMQGLERKKN